MGIDELHHVYIIITTVFFLFSLIKSRMGRVATIIVGGQEVTILNYDTDQPIYLSSSDDEDNGRHGSDGSASDDGDWRPKGVRVKKLNKSLSNANQTKRNLFKNSDSGIGSDGNTSGSSRTSSLEEPTKTEKNHKSALSRAARAQARNEKEYERVKEMAKAATITPIKSTVRSPKSLPKVKPMSRPTKNESYTRTSTIDDVKSVLEESMFVLDSEPNFDPKVEGNKKSKTEAKKEKVGQLLDANEAMNGSELDEDDLEDWQQDEIIEHTYKCEMYEEDCTFACSDETEFKRHVDKVHLGMDVGPSPMKEDACAMDDLPLC